MLMDIALILFALFLYMLCASLLVFEVFIPSFGLLTLLAAGAFIWATSIFFGMGTTVGWVGLGAAVFILPTFWVLVYKLFPHTSVGRAMILRTQPRDIGDALPDRDKMQDLLGKTGKAVGILRPVGICEIDGRRVVCNAETGFIKKNETVEVVQIQGNTVTVRTIETKP